MTKGQIISVCGNNCSECPRYIATQNNDLPELQYLSELWYRLGFREKIVSPEELKCNGCTPEKECSYQINKCKELEKSTSCGRCKLFPCGNLERVFEKADYYKKICKERCTEQEYKILSRAFLVKKEILTTINHHYKAK